MNSTTGGATCRLRYLPDDGKNRTFNAVSQRILPGQKGRVAVEGRAARQARKPVLSLVEGRGGAASVSNALKRVPGGQPAPVNESEHHRLYPGRLDRAGRWPAIAAKAARTQNARQALDYVARAEVDATFVRATDVPIR